MVKMKNVAHASNKKNKQKTTNHRQRRKLEFHKQIAGMQTSRVKLM